MVRRLVAEVEAQEFAQTQAVGQAPGNPSFTADALAVADQQRPEIHPRRDARPTLHRLVETLAKLLGFAVELAFVENLVHLRV
jgi:hypothetical protein